MAGLGFSLGFSLVSFGFGIDESSNSFSGLRIVQKVGLHYLIMKASGIKVFPISNPWKQRMTSDRQKKANTSDGPEDFQKTPYSYEEFYARYYVHRIAALAVVTDFRDRVLLVQQLRGNKKVWGLPGGILEKGESFIEAAVREVREETNIVCEPHSIIAVNTWAGTSIFPDDPHRHASLDIILGAKYVSGELKGDGEEILDLKFVTREEIKEFSLHEQLINLLSLKEGLRLIDRRTKLPEKYFFSFVSQN